MSLTLGLLALAVLCVVGCRRKTHPRTPPVVPAPFAAPVAPADAQGVETPARPLPPRNGPLSQLDQIRWQMHDNARAMVEISKQRSQREAQIREQDAEAQRLFGAGASGREAYQARMRQDPQIQEFDTRSDGLQTRQRVWAEMCRKLDKGTATP